MEIFHGYARSRDLVPRSSFHCAPNASLRFVYTSTMGGIQFRQATLLAKFRILAIKNAYRAFITTSSLPKGLSGGTLELFIDKLPCIIHHSEFSVQSSPKMIESDKSLATANEECQVGNLDVDPCYKEDDASKSADCTSDIHGREMQRRRKIGLANKGRTPWNKGRTHSEETRDHISKRTIAALMDPKVRKKMSEYPRSHSDHSKARISYAMRKIWEERLRQRRLQENCYLNWARSIAESAKEGFPSQEKLEWNSYERIRSDIISQHFQQKIDKAKVKEIAKLRAKEAAKIRAENKAMLAQLRKENEEKKAKAREIKALARRKAEDVRIKMALTKGKARLTKFHHHKRNSRSSASMQREGAIEFSQRSIDKLGVDLVKIQKVIRSASLDDQIQAMKNIKAEFCSSIEPVWVEFPGHIDSRPAMHDMKVIIQSGFYHVYVKSSYFPHSPSSCLKWKARSQAVLTDLKSLNADFLCIQELDEYDSFYKSNMESDGYSSIYVQRTGQKRDGCGIFYKNKSAELVVQEEINYNDLVASADNGNSLSEAKSNDAVDVRTNKDIPVEGKKTDGGDHGNPNDPRVRLKRDCVGVLAAFKLSNFSQHVVIVANTHIYWDPDWIDVKLAQVKYLLLRITQFKEFVSDKYGCSPSVIVAGDFNSTPGDEVYKYIISANPAAESPGTPYQLCSLYGTNGGEPQFTNCTPGFTGTLDYIFLSSTGHIKPVSLLELPGPDSPDVVGGLPNRHHPSDHLPIGADFEVLRTHAATGGPRLNDLEAYLAGLRVEGPKE